MAFVCLQDVPALGTRCDNAVHFPLQYPQLQAAALGLCNKFLEEMARQACACIMDACAEQHNLSEQVRVSVGSLSTFSTTLGHQRLRGMDVTSLIQPWGWRLLVLEDFIITFCPWLSAAAQALCLHRQQGP